MTIKSVVFYLPDGTTMTATVGERFEGSPAVVVSIAAIEATVNIALANYDQVAVKGLPHRIYAW